jgi:predicted phosphodiesterase
MRFAVISDIHANPWALQSVMDLVGDVDEIYCLGDIVGIGPDPSGVIDMLRKDGRVRTVMGNHDHNTLFGTQLGPLEFVPRKPHHDWVRERLTDDHLDYLKAPMTRVLEEGKCSVFMHRHPDDCGSKVPYFDDSSPPVLDDFYKDVPGDVLFFGHTHFELDVIGSTGRRYINPGAVGAQNGGIARFVKVETSDGRYVVERGKATYDIQSVRDELKEQQPPYWRFIKDNFFECKTPRPSHR